MKAFLSSPFASHIISKDAAICDALRTLARLRHLHPVIHLDEVAASDHCIWSPLIQGQVIYWNTDCRWSWETAMSWCLHALEYAGFDTWIKSTSPRKPDYGTNGVDREEVLARRLGYRIVRESEVEGW